MKIVFEGFDMKNTYYLYFMQIASFYTSKVSKMIILQIQYFGVQARSRARQPKDVYHFKIIQLKLNAL